MKTFQKDHNSIHYTEEKLYCYYCKHQVEKVIEIKENNIYVGFDCCFYGKFAQIIKDANYITTRLIIDIIWNKRKKIIKKERGKLTSKLRYEILKRDKFKCVICGNNNRIEIDHIIPISKSGQTIKSNLRTLCFDCNRGKGTLIE